jgi:hypothetical protein
LRVDKTAGKPPRVEWDDVPLAMKFTPGETKHWTVQLESGQVTPGLHRVTITAADSLRLDDLLLRIERR